jgi:hypothetical protein
MSIEQQSTRHCGVGLRSEGGVKIVKQILMLFADCRLDWEFVEHGLTRINYVLGRSLLLIATENHIFNVQNI